MAATPIVVGDDEDLDELLAAVVEDDLLMETTSGQSLSHTAEAAAAQSHSGQWMQVSAAEWCRVALGERMSNKRSLFAIHLGRHHQICRAASAH